MLRQSGVSTRNSRSEQSGTSLGCQPWFWCVVDGKALDRNRRKLLLFGHASDRAESATRECEFGARDLPGRRSRHAEHAVGSIRAVQRGARASETLSRLLETCPLQDCWLPSHGSCFVQWHQFVQPFLSLDSA